MDAVQSLACLCRKRGLPGGCFFAKTSVEFASRPGAIRDRLAEVMAEWAGTLRSAIEEAQQLAQIRSDADTSQLAFVLHALSLAANWQFQLQRDPEVFGTAPISRGCLVLGRCRRGLRTLSASRRAGQERRRSPRAWPLLAYRLGQWPRPPH
ncbi:MAG: TetR family transcriptional regulator C-terminal domain-containing protein [Solirubrobacterales bacterium]